MEISFISFYKHLFIASHIGNWQEIFFSSARKPANPPIWCPPPMGFVVFYFNGSIVGNLCLTGLGSSFGIERNLSA